MSILLGDNFSYSAQKPLDGRLKYDTLASMIAVADSTMYDGCLAYCVATDKTYQWKSTNEVDPTLRKWREFSSGGSAIQVDELPEASSTEEGKIYQYIGADDDINSYFNGLFYTCVSDEESTPTYYWIPTEEWVGTHAAWEALPQAIKNHYHQKKVNFTDDDEGAVDMYSTSETKTNKVWIDGKPIYRKVLLTSSAVSMPTAWSSISGWSKPTNFDTLTFYNFPITYSGRLDISIGDFTFVSIGGSVNIPANTPLVIEYTKTTDG